MNSFSIYVSEKVFICLHFWKIFSLGKKFQGWVDYVSFSDLKILFYGFLSCIVSEEKSGVILVFVPLCSYSSLIDCFKIFFLSLVLNNMQYFFKFIFYPIPHFQVLQLLANYPTFYLCLFQSFFFFCVLFWIISLAVSSRSLILKCLSVNNPWEIFLISDNLVFISINSVWVFSSCIFHVSIKHV